MKKLTVNQRNCVYTQALIWYKNHIKGLEEDVHREPCGLCKAIWESLLILEITLVLTREEVEYLNPYGPGMSFFPEVYTQKPNGVYTYWFIPRDTQPRIEILEKAIALTQ